ncbi:hypothetical protein [Methylibium sp.]|uniref:hypothetical protein n=1 Tax=Methylibium sp. TaxID=2067992 RepID=UPI0017E172BC|nr:hypothetical protein [Methylibium sp.]MBA3589686.1 hypothetical protein [Methylibium sp.]
MSPAIGDNLIAWLANGQRGVSSDTIVQHLTSIVCLTDEEPAHPHDPDDLDRCLILLDRVPLLKLQLHGMRTCSPVWDALIDRWDEIEASHLDEVGLGWTKGHRAPRTFALMREVIVAAQKRSVA